MKEPISNPPKKVRHYGFLKSTWVYFTLMLLLALICTFMLSVAIVTICYKLGWLSVIPFFSAPFISFLIISLVGGTLFAVIVAKVIADPIKKLRDAMRKVSAGDLSVSLPVTSNSEIAQLTNDFNQMVHELGSIETLRNDFVANVSHEFKTPISSIDGYASLLQENVTDEERIEYAKRISESAKKLSVLITNILQLSRLENQSFVAEQNTYSLDEQIRQTILTFEPEWSRKDLILDIDLEPAMITNCEDLLDRVWSNLIGNAIKFTDNGGTIKISLTVSSEYIVTIKDTGIGMTEDVMAHIFDKFYQGDNSRSRQGNGLGLALVKQVLDLLGGTVSVKSQPGVGSEFTVYLPIYK